MEETLQASAEFLFLLAIAWFLVIWNKPAKLVKWADRIERLATHILRQIRLRAVAKNDADRAYRRSYEWHERIW